MRSTYRVPALIIAACILLCVFPIKALASSDLLKATSIEVVESQIQVLSDGTLVITLSPRTSILVASRISNAGNLSLKKEAEFYLTGYSGFSTYSITLQKNTNGTYQNYSSPQSGLFSGTYGYYSGTETVGSGGTYRIRVDYYSTEFPSGCYWYSDPVTI